jgi:hypothetical protein
MIHVFLDNSLVKVGDISYISRIMKKDNYPSTYENYFFEVILSNNTQLQYNLYYKISKIYRYTSELNRQEEIDYHFGDYRVIGKEIAELTFNVNSKEYYLKRFDENLNCFKEFKVNYQDLLNKFEKVNNL